MSAAKAAEVAEMFARIRRGPQKMYNAAKTDAVLTTPPSVQMQTESYDGSQSNLSTSTTLNLSTTSSNPDGRVHNVVESKVSLLPSCYTSHGKLKGKAKLNLPRRCSLKTLGCGKHQECIEGVIVSSSATEDPFRLMTGNAMHDLERWLTTPNSQLYGGEAERTLEFVRNDRVSDIDLEDIMAIAIGEIQYQHVYINSLIKYAQRAPYKLHLRAPEQASQDTAK